MCSRINHKSNLTKSYRTKRVIGKTFFSTLSFLFPLFSYRIIIIIIIIIHVTFFSTMSGCGRYAAEHLINSINMFGLHANISVESGRGIQSWINLTQSIALQGRPQPMSSDLKVRLSHGHVVVDSIVGTLHSGCSLQCRNPSTQKSRVITGQSFSVMCRFRLQPVESWCIYCISVEHLIGENVETTTNKVTSIVQCIWKVFFSMEMLNLHF